MAASTTSNNLVLLADEKTHQKQDNYKKETNDDSISIKQWPSRISQKLIVVWLDPNINESHEEYHNLIIRLRHITNAVHLFTEVDPCIDFISNIEDGRFSFILSHNLSMAVIPVIHDLSQIDSIYVTQNEKIELDPILIEWKKVRGIFADFLMVFDQLQQTYRQSDQDIISTNIFSVDSIPDLDGLDQSFMYSVLLKEILLEMNYDKRAKINLFKFYRDQNSSYQVNVSKINEMENDYDQRSPISWYIEQPFIFSVLNTALRTQNVTNIIRMGFYLKDLHQHIERIYSRVNKSEKLNVHRGQLMSNNEFEKMRKSTGGLLSFNNFLSTTVDRKLALTYVDSTRSITNCTNILFDMEIDPTVSKTPFAPLKLVNGCSHREDEILFSMHTVFRICDIVEMPNGVWNVKITMTNDTDAQLERLTNRIREEIQGSHVLHRLGNLMVKMGQFDKAEETYNALLEMLSNEDSKELVHVYNQLGNVLIEKGDLEKALSFLEKPIELKEQSSSSNFPDLSTTYINIGLVYNKLGQYSKALSYYEKTRDITESTLPMNHPELATTYTNIASVCDHLGEYSEALLYYEKAIVIRKRTLPSNHPDLATAYNNMGSVYANMGDYSKALEFYELMLEIAQKTLPSDHPSLASCYNNIGSTHQTMGDYPTALRYLEKTLEIQQKTLPENHPDLATTFHNIGWVCHSMGEYTKALSYLERSLQIRQVSLPENHPHLATIYNAIGLVHHSTGEYSKALVCLQNTLTIFGKTLPPNHPSHAETYNNIGSVYQALGEYSKALSFYEKTFEIREKTLPPNHPDLAVTYNNIGMIYNSMGEYSKALSYYEKTLQIQKISLPPTHPSLANTYNYIGLAHSAMNDDQRAIPYYKKALKIQQQGLPSNHPSLATTYNNIGRAHASQEHYAFALQYYKDALKIQENALPPNHPSLADTYKNVGEMYLRTGDCLAALQNYEKTLAIENKVLSSNHPSLAITYGNLSEVYYSMTNYERALSFVKKAIDIQSNSFPSNHRLLASSYYHSAIILKKLHQCPEAITHVSKAIQILSCSTEPDYVQLEKYQEYRDELVAMNGDNPIKQNSEYQKWFYSVLLVRASAQESELYSILNTITDGLLKPSIQVDKCIDTLQLDDEITDLIIEVSSTIAEERDKLLEMISSFENIKSLYLLGKPPESRKDRNNFYQKFDKVCLFCDDKEQLVIRWSLDMASNCRISGNQCNDAGDKTTARKHFQRGVNIYNRLTQFMRTT